MNLILLAFSVVFILAELFFLKEFKKRKNKNAVKSAIVSIVFSACVYAACDLFDLAMPDTAYILVVITLFSDSYYGHYRRLYYKSKKYDRVQHVIGSFSFAIFFYFLLSNLFEYGGSGLFRAFYILLLGVFWGTIYEIIEFVSDLKNERKMQRGLKDTDMDMVSDVIGSLSAAVISYFVFLQYTV